MKECMCHRIPVVEHLTSVDPDITLATEEWVWSAVTTTDYGWTISTMLADPSCRMLSSHHGVDQSGSLFLPPP